MGLSTRSPNNICIEGFRTFDLVWSIVVGLELLALLYLN
jgi:hypothetical protein